jgi:hypothetical protein
MLDPPKQDLAPLIPRREVFSTRGEGRGGDPPERGGLEWPVGECRG